MARIRVRVVPRAKHSGIEPLSDGGWRVKVTAPAEDGRANAAVIELLAQHFKVPKRAVTIRRGLTSRSKLVEIHPPPQGPPALAGEKYGSPASARCRP